MFSKEAMQILKWMYEQDRQGSGKPQFYSTDTIQQATNLSQVDCRLTLRSLAPTYVDMMSDETQPVRLTSEGLRIASMM